MSRRLISLLQRNWLPEVRHLLLLGMNEGDWMETGTNEGKWMMNQSNRSSAKYRQPELEADFIRTPTLGFDPKDQVGLIRCLEHGYPTPLTRWHCHDEYELHIITETSGKAFVGDWIGPYEPGLVALCGPRLPHVWIANEDSEPTKSNHLVIQFRHEPIEQAIHGIREFSEALPLLERSRNGIEFFNCFDRSIELWKRVKSQNGLMRLAAFLEFLSVLARWTDYRLLSTAQMRGDNESAEYEQINRIVKGISENLTSVKSASQLARELGMSESGFSRFFQRATGNTYTDFVNQVRVNRACQLLMNTDRYVASIGFEVGFNSLANFNRRFLRAKGLTPSEFRKETEARFAAYAVRKQSKFPVPAGR